MIVRRKRQSIVLVLVRRFSSFSLSCFRKKPLDSVSLFDWNQHDWRKLTSMATARAYPCGTMDKSRARFVVAGGFNNRELNSAEIFDIKAEKWLKAPSMPTSRTKCGGAIIGDYFAVVSQSHCMVDYLFSSITVFWLQTSFLDLLVLCEVDNLVPGFSPFPISQSWREERGERKGRREILWTRLRNKMMLLSRWNLPRNEHLMWKRQGHFMHARVLMVLVRVFLLPLFQLHSSKFAVFLVSSWYILWRC